jgi:hypothetical protein
MDVFQQARERKLCHEALIVLHCVTVGDLGNKMERGGPAMLIPTNTARTGQGRCDYS